WTSVGALYELPDGKPAKRMIDDVPVLLYRMGDRVTAMVERCGHETGPLSEGEIIGTDEDACVVCPWHGSTFRLRDGRGAGGCSTSWIRWLTCADRPVWGAVWMRRNHRVMLSVGRETGELAA